MNEYQVRILADLGDVASRFVEATRRFLEAHRAQIAALQRALAEAARWLAANRAALEAFLNPQPMELVAAYPMPVRRTRVFHVEPSEYVGVRKRRRRRIGFIIDYD